MGPQKTTNCFGLAIIATFAAVIVLARHDHRLPSAHAQTVPPTPTATATVRGMAYLAVVSSAPTSTYTSTPAPTSTATATPTAAATPTATRDPNVPVPINVPAQSFVLTQSDVPQGWVISPENGDNCDSTCKAKRIGSSYWVEFYDGTCPCPDLGGVLSQATVYLDTSAAEAGMGRVRKAWTDDGCDPVTFAQRGTDSFACLLIKSGYWDRAVVVIRHHNIIVQASFAYRDPDFPFTGDCAEMLLHRADSGYTDKPCDIIGYDGGDVSVTQEMVGLVGRRDAIEVLKG